MFRNYFWLLHGASQHMNTWVCDALLLSVARGERHCEANRKSVTQVQTARRTMLKETWCRGEKTGCGEEKSRCGEEKSGCREEKSGCGEEKTGCGEEKSGCGEEKLYFAATIFNLFYNPYP